LTVTPRTNNPKTFATTYTDNYFSMTNAGGENFDRNPDTVYKLQTTINLNEAIFSLHPELTYSIKALIKL